MTTHRSLNKLEFKAHMSIHNLVEVTETQTPLSHYTRDRFGKHHNLTDGEGRPWVKRLTRAAAVAFFCALFSAPAFAEDPMRPAPQEESSKVISVNTKVESDQIQVFKKDQHEPVHDPLVFYKDEKTEVGLDKKGRAKVSMPW